MIALTGSFMVVEVVSGIVTNSLALISDGMHMLSDVLALSIGLYSYWLKFLPRDSRYTFGFGRADVVGSIVNAVFLLSVAFTIALEALQRLVETPEVSDGQQVMIVAGIGLVVNLAGIFLFHEHAHSHGGGHDHGHGHGHGHDHDHDDDHQHASSLGMHGVFLHILGDLLGSVGVLISGSVIEYTDWENRFLVDPIVSLLISILIAMAGTPLLKASARILMQQAPDAINMDELEKDFGEHDLDMHDFHVWAIDSGRAVATAHVKFASIDEFELVASKMRAILHRHGVHSLTVQPEFNSTTAGCEAACGPDCADQTCCSEPPQMSPQKKAKVVHPVAAV